MSARILGVGSLVWGNSMSCEAVGVVWDNPLSCEDAAGGVFVDSFRSRRRHKVGIRLCLHVSIIWIGIVTPMSQPHDNIFNIINITLGHIWVTLIVNNVLCRSAITI